VVKPEWQPVQEVFEAGWSLWHPLVSLQLFFSVAVECFHSLKAEAGAAATRRVSSRAMRMRSGTTVRGLDGRAVRLPFTIPPRVRFAVPCIKANSRTDATGEVGDALRRSRE
jgi:hypothetical protein